MNRAPIYDIAATRFIQRREDALFPRSPGTGKAISRKASAALPSSKAIASASGSALA